MTTVANQPTAKAPPELKAPPARTAGTHVMLWSQSQCALHIEPLDAMLSSNRRAYADDRRMDFVPLYIGTDEDCRQIADSVRGTMKARQDARREASQA